MQQAMACALVLAASCGGLAAAQESELWLNPLCERLELPYNGPFEQLEDGTLLVIDKNVLRKSTDGGQTWEAVSGEIASGLNIGFGGHPGQFLQTRNGTLVVLYLDFDNYKFSWNDEKGEPNPECRLELWALRSTDGGQTWTDKQQLLPGYNADFMGFIEVESGGLVATVEHLDPELCRWVAMSFFSDDEGKTWQHGNVIDLGGRGHHDGAVEPCVVALKDGRLLMFIRTGLGQFWYAWSEDDGKYWRTIQPSGIDASSAPGWVERLASGRLVFVWNRSKPEGAEKPTKLWHGQGHEVPAPSHREELSIAFSEDDGQTWTRPVVLMREPDGQLAYPYVLERTPGELWVMTRYTYSAGGKTAPPIKVRIFEKDFVGGEE